MPIIDAILPEFDQEMATTRKVIERVPDDRLDWRPHPKSWTMGALATHLVTIPAWTVETFGRDNFDLMPEGKQPVPQAPAKSREELLSRFDAAVAAARQSLALATDAAMFQSWSLLTAGKPVLTLPRAAMLRAFILSHSIHHRAQLALYLRMNDIPVPSIYGPSGDEAAS